MLSTVRTYIEKHHLLSSDKPVIVGFSGGADSVALLTLLQRLGYSCIAVHCNFHLRGEESNRDENFARLYAEKLHIPFYKKDFSTEAFATENGISIEMAARDVRYAWFNELIPELEAQGVAIAHHQDDSVETTLINLIRGTGIKGLRGILPKNGNIVRPLLCVTREEIIHWLQQEAIPFVTDSTNLTDLYTRNFIRLQVLPLLEKINPSVKESIFRSSSHLADVEKIYNESIEKARKEIVKDNSLSIPLLLSYPAPETILYELLKPYGFNNTVVHSIFESLDKESGKLFFSEEWALVKDREYLYVSPKEEKTEITYSLEEGITCCEDPIKLSFEKVVINKEFCIRRDRNTAYFDYDKLTFPLILRYWQPGDWFIPFGMTGRKKISDYYSDRKYSRFGKEKQWLLCSGNDILWIVGERTDNRYKITQTTRNVLVVNFSG